MVVIVYMFSFVVAVALGLFLIIITIIITLIFILLFIIYLLPLFFLFSAKYSYLSSSTSSTPLLPFPPLHFPSSSPLSAAASTASRPTRRHNSRSYLSGRAYKHIPPQHLTSSSSRLALPADCARKGGGLLLLIPSPGRIRKSTIKSPWPSQQLIYRNGGAAEDSCVRHTDGQDIVHTKLLRACLHSFMSRVFCGLFFFVWCRIYLAV